MNGQAHVPACALANATPAQSAAVVFAAPCAAAWGLLSAPGALPTWGCGDASPGAGELRSGAAAGLGLEAAALAEASAVPPKKAKSGDSGSGSCGGHAHRICGNRMPNQRELLACMAF